MNDSELRSFCDFVRDRLGLDFHEKNWASLRKTLSRAAATHGFGSPDEFAVWARESIETSGTIDVLASLLTIGETFFFRDMKAFEAIESTILPQLIDSRTELKKKLKIWSAGCSTGEEPYSMAILLKRKFWFLAGESIKILATDINKESLIKAQEGLYREWSFRGGPDWLKKEYFSRVGAGYLLSATIKAMVEFRRLNLVSPHGYSSTLGEFGTFDLILCRNTLMYFTAENRNAIIQSLLLWLNEGGWLILSPSEIPHIVHDELQMVKLPGAIFFRKKARDQAPLVFSPSPKQVSRITARTESGDKLIMTPPMFAPKRDKSNIDSLEDKILAATEALDKSNYRKVLSLLEGWNEDNSPTSRLYGQAQYLVSKAHANTGMLQEAQKAIENAIETDKLNVTYHMLYASILQAGNLIDEASDRLKKVLFLDPDHIMANVTLGTIHKKLNHRAEALRCLKNALNSLAKLAPEELLQDSDGETAGRLKHVVESTIAAIRVK